MPKSLICLVNCLFVGLFVSPRIEARQETLADYLDRDVAAVVIVSNPQVLYERLIWLFDDTNEQWNNIVEVATNPKFGFVTPEQLALFHETGVLIEDWLAQVQEIGFIWHDLPTKKFSLVVRVPPAMHADVISQGLKLHDTILLIGEKVSLPRYFKRETLPDDSAAKAMSNSNKVKPFAKSAGEWLIFSNDLNKGQTLLNRIESQTAIDKTTLKSSRKYQRVVAAFQPDSDREANVIAYGNPEKLGSLFFPELDNKTLSAYQFSELPAMGLRLHIAPPSIDEQMPVLLAEFVLPFTEPRVGFAAQLSAYTTLAPLPTIPFNITDLHAAAYDPIELNGVTREIMDSVNEVGDYDSKMQSESARYSRDYLKDTLPRLDQFVVFRYSHPRVDRLDSIQLEHVRDVDAMKRYQKGYIDTINAISRREGNGNVYRRKSTPFGDMLVQRPLAATARLDNLPEPSNNSANKSNDSRQLCFFMDDQWSIIGQFDAVQKQVDAMYGAQKQSPAVGMINQIREDWGNSDQVFKIRFMSPYYFELHQFEDRLIREKFAQDPERRRQLLYGPLNEKGYRLEITSVEESQLVVVSMIAKLLAKKLGSLLFLYYKEETGMRVKGGLFPKLNSHYLQREQIN